MAIHLCWCLGASELPAMLCWDHSRGCCSRRRNTPGGKYDKDNCREGVRKGSNRFPSSGNGSCLKAATVVLLLHPLRPCPCCMGYARSQTEQHPPGWAELWGTAGNVSEAERMKRSIFNSLHCCYVVPPGARIQTCISPSFLKED